MNATALPTATDREHTVRPRKVSFDYGNTPTHWVPNDPHTTHVVNVLHLLLPAGERWFCDVCRRALPEIDDPDLARHVKAFIGQEATHSRAHALVLEDLEARGIDHRAFTRLVDWGFGVVKVRTAPRWLPRPIARWVERQYLRNQLAGIAAIEHFTAVLGWWIVDNAGALDEAGADEEMMALLRWHGAEEVEHRSVAFDAYKALGGGYIRQCLYILAVFVAIAAAWIAGTHFLMRRDRTITRRRRGSLREFVRASRQGRLPSIRSLIGAVPRYMKPSYHPSQEGDTAVAKAYLDGARGVVPYT